MSGLEVIPQILPARERATTSATARVLLTPACAVTACTLLAAATLGSASLMLVAILANISALALIVCWSPARATIARYARRKQRGEQRRCRRARIRGASAAHEAELAELSSRLEELERIDPNAITRYRLDDILDDYVELALASRRAIKAIELIDRPEVERRLSRIDSEDGGGGGDDRSEITVLHRRLLEQRAEHSEACSQSISFLQVRLAMIADYVRLISERAAPGAPPVTAAEEIISRLDGLDAADLELAELTR